MIEWLKEARYSERYAPVYAAFVAYVRGKRYLLDNSPEVSKLREDYDGGGEEEIKEKEIREGDVRKRRREGLTQSDHTADV